jgi:Fe-S-cluster-containing hydrogenase component 2
MATKPLDENNTAEKSQGVSRRELIAKAGVGVAGVVVGGAVASAIPRSAAPSPPTPTTWIGRNLASCTGCRLCQIACSLKKENRIWPGVSRISVRQWYPGVEFPVACYQCGAEAKCAEACPTAALTVDTSKGLNTIAVDTKKCTRTAKNSDCTLCLDKCPGLIVEFHPKTREPLFCDLCGGEPECVKVCPSQTLTNRGLKIAAIQPKEIAAGLWAAYKVPEINKTVPREGGGPGGAAPGGRGAAPGGRGAEPGGRGAAPRGRDGRGAGPGAAADPEAHE